MNERVSGETLSFAFFANIKIIEFLLDKLHILLYNDKADFGNAKKEATMAA